MLGPPDVIPFPMDQRLSSMVECWLFEAEVQNSVSECNMKNLPVKTYVPGMIATRGHHLPPGVHLSRGLGVLRPSYPPGSIWCVTTQCSNSLTVAQKPRVKSRLLTNNPQSARPQQTLVHLAMVTEPGIPRPRTTLEAGRVLV